MLMSSRKVAVAGLSADVVEMFSCKVVVVVLGVPRRRKQVLVAMLRAEPIQVVMEHMMRAGREPVTLNRGYGAGRPVSVRNTDIRNGWATRTQSHIVIELASLETELTSFEFLQVEIAGLETARSGHGASESGSEDDEVDGKLHDERMNFRC